MKLKEMSNKEKLIWSVAIILVIADICVFINLFNPLPDIVVVVSSLISILSIPAIFYIGLRISKRRKK